MCLNIVLVSQLIIKGELLQSVNYQQISFCCLYTVIALNNMFSMLASMGHLGYCISLQMSHFQAMWIRNAFLLILWGWWGWKNICFKLKEYHNFGDPNDQVLKNNALHYGNIRLALQSYGDKCTHTAVTCVIASGF